MNREQNDLDLSQLNNTDFEGVDDLDSGGPVAPNHRPAGDAISPDAHAIGTVNIAMTADGGLAIDGGKLPGNGDDFEGELNSRRLRNVPGADPNNEVSPGA